MAENLVTVCRDLLDLRANYDLLVEAGRRVMVEREGRTDHATLALVAALPPTKEAS